METVPCIAEAEALLELLDEPAVRATGLQAWLSVAGRDGARLNSGEPAAALAALAARAPAAHAGGALAAVGVNCSAPQHIPALLAALAPVGLPLVAYPNKGEEWDVAARAFVPGTATSDAAFRRRPRPARSARPNNTPALRCARVRCAARCARVRARGRRSALAAEWVSCGARGVGGCCRTTTDTIRAVRAALRG